MALDERTLGSLSQAQLNTIQKIHDEAIRQGVNPEFAVAIAEAETGGKFSHYGKNGVLTSPAGAKGVMQMMPDTANLYNKKFKLDINPDDEDSNIKGGVFILKDLLGTYKNPRFASAMYNASPKAAGQFVSMYQTDPDKAITSLPEETQKYLYRISKNFNLDNDKETGLYSEKPAEGEEAEPPKPPFVPVASTFPPPSANQDQTQTKPENVVSPTTGLLAGALASTVGQYPFTSELETAKPPPDLDTAEKAANKAQRQFDIAEERLNQRVNSGRPIAGGSHLVILEDEFRRSQLALQLAEKQLQDAVAAQKAKVSPSPAPVVPSAPAAGSLASATPSGPAIITDPNTPSADQHTRAIQGTTVDDVTGRARQTTYNERTSQIARNAANQQQVLQALGQQGIVDPSKAFALTEGISGSTPSGVMVNPDLAGEKQQQAELQQKMADDKAAQERLAQQQEIDRLKNERALAAQQNSQAQSAFNKAQSAKTSSVARAQNTMETAEDKARLLAEELDEARKAGKNAPSATGRILQNTGVKVGKGSNIVKGGLGALGGYEAAKGINTLANLSLADLQKRYDEGDRSPALMAAIAKAAEATAQIGAGTAAAMPAFGPQTAKIKGAGIAGTAALGAMQLWNASKEKAKQRRDNQ